MAISKLLILAFFFVSSLSPTPVASSFPFVYGLCNVAKFSDHTPFQNNLNKVLAALVELSSSTTYNTASYGSGVDKIRGVFQCRGDQSKSDCYKCVDDIVTNELGSGCPNAVGARIQLDQCYLRYENYSFLTPDYTQDSILCNTNDNTDKRYQDKVDAITSTVLAAAPHNGGYFTASSSIKEGSGNRTEVYGLAQCIGYLSEHECMKCLSKLSDLRQLCSNAVGAQIHSVTCYYRYEDYPFYISKTKSS